MAGSFGLLLEELRAVRSTRFVRGDGGFISHSDYILGHLDVEVVLKDLGKQMKSHVFVKDA